MNEQKPSGSFVLWQNTLCNPLADSISMTHSAWHDGYASAKADRKPLTDAEMPILFVGGLALNSKATTEIVRAVEKAHGIGEQT